MLSRARLQDQSFKVLAAPTLGTRWLVPRLLRFKDAHPELNVSVGLFHSSYEEFIKGNYDCGIDCMETGGERPLEFDATLLRREELAPVCSPSLLHKKPLCEPADLASHTLLHPTPGDPYDWRKWLRAAGLDDFDIADGNRFQTLEMAVGAAVAGLGIAIADLLLIQHELEKGQLIAPFELVVSAGTGYNFFYPSEQADDPKIVAFRDWLLEEARAKE